MAICKHTSSKNGSYGAVLDYMKYEHEEHGDKNKTGHYEPILDEHGLMIERKNCEVLYLNSAGELDDPEHFATDCYITNNKFNQNQKDTDRKNHMYILSFNPKDQDKLDMDKMREIALKFAKENFPGHQCLIGIHCDKDHYHIHFTINSCRDQDREQLPYMALNKDGQVKDSEVKAGMKHDDSPYLRRWLNDRALEISKEYGLDDKDMNKAHDDKQAERPDKNAILRNEVLQIAGRSNSIDDFKKKIKKAGMNYRYNKTDKVFTSFTAKDAKRATRMDKLDLTMSDIEKAIGAEKHRPLDRNISEDTRQQINQTIRQKSTRTFERDDR